MSRNWQTIFQKGTSGLSKEAIDQLSGIEVDLATALAGGASAAVGVTFSHSGAATVGFGSFRCPVSSAATISGVLVTAGTAPTGADLVVDVNLNGTTVFTTQANRPTVAAGTHMSSLAVPDVTAVSSLDYLTVDIDQVGSSVAGSDLVVVVFFG